MKNRPINRSRKAGLSPGSLIHLGQQKMDRVEITLIDYDDKELFTHHKNANLSDLAIAHETNSITWVNVAGLHDVDVIGQIGKIFNIHPLLLEDMLNTDQRPKTEQYDNYVYLILKALHWQNDHITTEQVSIVLGQTFVLTFQEQEKDNFDPIRQRLANDSSRLRHHGADYLAYSLLDIVVDNYFLMLEYLGERIERLEDALVFDPEQILLEDIHELKREMRFLRRSVWPLREVIGSMQRGESTLIQQGTLIYLRDVYEHTIQVIDTVETFRDIVSGLLDLYLTSVSNKMNEVMKVLTVIATIFIPLTFITGLYGMNFVNMPELQWQWGYWGVWGVIAGTTILLIAYFRRKKWL